MANYYPGITITPNLGMSLVGMDEAIAENLVLIDTFAPTASNIQINGSVVGNPNFNANTPMAPAGYGNVIWQKDGSGNISGYVPFSGSAAYFCDSAASDIPTYFTLLNYVPTNPQTTFSASGKNTSGQVLIAAFATSPDQPSTTLIPSGQWTTHVFASVDSIAQGPSIYVYVYKRDAFGVETQLWSTNFLLTSTAITVYELSVEELFFSTNATDRLVFKYYMLAGGSSTRTVTLYVDGTVNDTHMHLPLDAVNIVQAEPVKAITATTYTVLDSDRRYLLTFSNASPIAVTLPQADGTVFGDGWFTDVENVGSGLVTITPTVSTINGAAFITLPQNQSCRIISDGTNYWAVFQSSSNATTLQTVPISVTAPVDGQILSYSAGSGTWQPTNQPVGNNYKVRYATDFAWTQTSGAWPALTAGVLATVTLNAWPTGIDITGNPALGGPHGGYMVYISDGANSEAVYVSGGNSGTKTIQFTPFFSHTAGVYTIMSASAGIQEAINDAAGIDPVSTWKNGRAKIVLPSANVYTTVYDVYGTIYFHANDSILSGYGAILNCHQRGPAIQVGNQTGANAYGDNRIEGLIFRIPESHSSDAAYAGTLIASTQRTSGTITITTATNHNLRTGDAVTIMFTDHTAYWGDVPTITVTSPTTFTYTRTGAADLALASTPGVVALTFVGVLSNANGTHMVDFSMDAAGQLGKFNHFFDLWDDEHCTIENFDNAAISLNGNANWIGSFVFSGGAHNLSVTSQQLAPVISIRNCNFTANGSCGITVYNSNGLYVYDTVIQAAGPWQVYSSNDTGNFQGASLRNLYTESGTGTNPLSPAKTPWPGCGISGFISGTSTAAAFFTASGSNPGGTLPTYGSGTTTYVYYVVINDVTAGTHSSPLPCMYWKESTPTAAVSVIWPRSAYLDHVITYDVLRVVAPSGSIVAAAGGFVAPYIGGCPGGSVAATGSVATGLAQGAGFVQSFTDNTNNATVAYTPTLGSGLCVIPFWPGDYIGNNGSTCLFIDSEVGQAFGVNLNGLPVQVALFGSGYGASTNGGSTILLASRVNNTVVNQSATIFTDGAVAGGGLTQSKGRVNFGSTGLAAMTKRHIITLSDSNPAKTRATTTYRPLADAADTWVGTDGGTALNAQQLAFGCPVSISNYINNIGDGTSWLERLTATAKAFSVPVQLASYTIATLPASPANGMMVYATDGTPSTNPATGGGTGAFVVRQAGVWRAL